VRKDELTEGDEEIESLFAKQDEQEVNEGVGKKSVDEVVKEDRILDWSQEELVRLQKEFVKVK